MATDATRIALHVTTPEGTSDATLLETKFACPVTRIRRRIVQHPFVLRVATQKAGTVMLLMSAGASQDGLGTSAPVV